MSAEVHAEDGSEVRLYRSSFALRIVPDFLCADPCFRNIPGFYFGKNRLDVVDHYRYLDLNQVYFF